MSRSWNRRVFLRAAVVTAAAGATTYATGISATADTPRPPGPGAGRLRVERTTAEYAENLLGTDSAAPHLSWELRAGGRGARQSAYQVRVATDQHALSRRPFWDSGRVVSDRTVNVPYAGPRLRDRTRYHWQVRVWDEQGRASSWSAVRWWETALPADGWLARWIGADAPPAPPGFEGTSWIWSPGTTTSGAPVGPRWFRAALELPAGADVTKATVTATADDDFTLHLDGRQVLHQPESTDSWRIGHSAEVTAQVRAAGRQIVLAAVATNRGSAANPAGLLLRLDVETGDGRHQLVTGEGWRTSDTEREGWQRPDHDDSSWPAAAVLAPYGQGPWGKGVSLGVPELPAPLLRREFTVRKPVTRARLYIAGLAYYDAEINGRRVGRQVLDPGFTDYDKTVLYAVHDVTERLERGFNAIGVTLGRGFFGMTTPNVWNWHTPPWHGEPRLLAQLEIDHPDGTRTTVASGPDWRITDGPTLTNSLYAGETYDARRAPRSWTKPGFKDGEWRAATVQSAPKGAVRAQPHDPIEIIETIRPTGVSELSPGVHVVDMGRTLAGWTRLTVAADAGTTVRLVHGEKLKDDGSVHAETGHVPGRFQTDEYVCGGGGEETWEPKFSYKGFRYVQISGLPRRPSPEHVLGRVVHTRVDEVSEFRCSEPFYERLDKAMRRTVLNNLHGIPTDTPMYEKNGWTGDAQLGAPVMAYAFGVHRFLSKWLGDLADSQNTDGQLPVIVPSGGWGYGDLGPSPEWTTVYPFLVREMYRVYGDDRVAREHWPTLTRYLDWEIARLKDGLAVTALGDYLPPGYGGNPPEDTRLTATAYLHRALVHTAEMAQILGEKATADRYRTAAEQLRSAFNAAFLSPEGHYRTAKDPGYRQTSNAIPLAFGLAPASARASVTKSLLEDVAARGNHLNTGALGTSVLFAALTAEGHPDVAHAIATQRTYPSWGYWFDHGADTMWEMWQLDSRSRDHYFQGTVVQWLYENVAGLRPGDAGYRTFTVRPDARTGVDWARTSIRTVRGRASVDWARTGTGLRLAVVVPVGAEAEVHVPAARQGDVGVPDGAEYVRSEPGHVIYRVAHGSWEFTATL
ncbi:family 78 glycoside hydrolase catalytic domain [Streptomyces lunaelactis]|uniref:alpha-L-rhamnosidase n=1 Tax=Streptomyces lunaelactis TaxID=1535768 RepID=UPI001584EDB1|nr:alpha-L-rhamnosidase [Streptomyces lunaelactis]NUK34474.1 family 78 glycoside hydrolase catalytic domain [Streptomyces lunaelactis]NUK39406.1 family 78 glycoside hydrolase catalytic domain [Streptomyces lunaelactis]NUK50344.1 family 78 glycoside hydrolase catalytic domain [Streptomyces lunaelactis]NUK64624.1 family 78 glycoside hydrolase catalytic domain [Streptomyces lunaelactis]NUK93012.1 family 78 glycoside hydrolase catalytic domain [Streptomyces lunaelactis]